MRSFNSVYNKERNDSINEHRASIDNDRARLIAAIKEEYGIKDFHALNENERNNYRNIINEMWNSQNGLTEKGIAFVNESEKPLTSVSTPEMINKYIIKNLGNNAESIFKNLAEGKKPEFVYKLKSDVEKSTGKKIKVSDYKTMIGNVLIDKILKKKIAEIKFNN